MAEIVESVTIRYEDMPVVETPSFAENDVGKDYVLNVKINLSQIDRSLTEAEGESPNRNDYVFTVSEVVSLVEDN